MSSEPTAPEQPAQQPLQQPAAAQPARPAQPAYGEYAPEGWEWKPEGAAADAAEAGSRTGGGVPAAPAGVPHNLGAPARSGDAAPARQVRPAADTQQGAGEPYRAAAPQQQNPQHQNPQHQNPQQNAQLPPAYRLPGTPTPRLGDRIVTIVLLAFGAFGALNIAASFFGLESQIRLTASLIGLEDATVASWVGPLGVVSGLVVLLLFALTLIFSIQRMRQHKITFWVPLAAGAIAFILLVVVPMIALSGAPEIMEQLQNDPTGSLDKMLNALTEMQTP